MARDNPGLLAYRRADGVEGSFPLKNSISTIGRAAECDLVIALPMVSREHARVELQHDHYILHDTSTYGTFVNGRRLDSNHWLRTDDVIWLGSTEVVLRFTDPEETQDTHTGNPAPALLIDTVAHTIKVYGDTVELSPLEYRLLLYLASDPGAVRTREECFQAVWGQPYDHATCKNALNACISKLHYNLGTSAQATGQATRFIKTIRGVGFRLEADVVYAQRNPDKKQHFVSEE